MSGASRRGRFLPGEIDVDAEGTNVEPELLATARQLEWLAQTEDVGPAPGFTDRVMAAVSQEPAPRPVFAAFGAARRRSPRAAFVALGDLWRVAFTGGRPFAARWPAMALVVLLVGGSVGVGAVGAGALSALLGSAPTATPALSSQPLGPSAPAEPSASPSPSPTEAESPEPSGQPEASESPEPADTAEPTGDPASSPAMPDGGVAGPTSTPGETAHPTSTLSPGETPNPGETRSPGETPNPGETRRPGESPGATPGTTPTPAGGSGDG
jgi:hypothetical protein